MVAVSFGGSQHERIEIDVAGYEQPEGSDNYHDANWLGIRIKVAAGAFRGNFDAALLTSEIDALRSQLRTLYASLKGSVKFETLEGQLILTFEGNGLGAIELRGEALDQAGIGNRLCFRLSLDQTQIGAALTQLDEVLERFPVRDV
jgi:hypothetical protein